MQHGKKAGTVLLKIELYVRPVIFFTVFLFSTECSSAQVEMFFQDLKSSVLNVFTHALTTQKISLLASQVHNLFVKLYSRDGGLTSDDSISYVFTFCLLCSDKRFFVAPLPALSRGPSMLLCICIKRLFAHFACCHVCTWQETQSLVVVVHFAVYIGNVVIFCMLLYYAIGSIGALLELFMQQGPQTHYLGFHSAHCPKSL